MILDKIVAQKKIEVARLLKDGPGEAAGEVDPPRGFFNNLVGRQGLTVIAEVKKASPSKGIICEDFDPQRIAADYKEGGADAISVLTDEQFFQGDLRYIPMIRMKVDLPVLRKDFIIHEIQIRQAGNYGADAILLIAAILDAYQIKDYLAMADELGMDCLVEVHDEKELEKALNTGSRLIGVNNRDLRDFTVDLNTTLRLKKYIPDEVPLISESGIGDHEDMVRLQEGGVTGVLVGESLMRAPDRSLALQQLKTGM